MNKEEDKKKEDETDSKKLKEMFDLVNSMQDEEIEYSPIPIVRE